MTFREPERAITARNAAAYSRRSLIRRLAVGAGSLACGLDGPLSRTVHAQPASPPRRLVIFPIANGVTSHTDFVANGATAENFQLGPFLAPLEAAGLRSDLVLLDNLEFRLPRADVDYHVTGIIELLTGAFYSASSVDRAQRISLDRYLATQTNVGKGRPLPQLNMGCMCDSVTYSYDAQGFAVPSNRDPLDIYKKAFGSLTQGTTADPSLVRRLARRQSVLDTVTKELTAFKARLGPEDARRADAQLTVIREMERRLSNAVPQTACTKPTAPDAKIDYTRDLYVPETMRAFIDLAVGALACDQTRVVLMHSYLREYHPANYRCPWAPVSRPDDDFHGLSHDTPGDGFASFARAKAFFFQLAGELANKLKQVPEAGGTMLDNTIIFVPTEIGAGHTAAGLQFVTIGGKGLGVRTGRYLRLGTDRAAGKGVPHQRLLVSLLNALGVPDPTFGDDPGSGGLPGFLAT